MSMYNIVVGHDPAAKVVVAVLQEAGLDVNTIPRFRDAYVIPAGDRGHNSTKLVILTRTGGGNRTDYQDENDALTRHGLYVSDHDDDFDPTYAHFLYDVPESRRDAIEELVAEGRGMGYDFPLPMERFKAAVDSISG